MTAPVEALVTKASKAAEDKRWDDALALLDEVLASEPNHLRALDLVGYVRFFQGSYAEGEQACRRALSLQPNHPYAHKGLGLCLARQGQLDEGVTSLERAIALDPAWFDPYWDLAVVLLEAGRFSAAARATERGARAVPAERGRFATLATRIEQRRQSGRSPDSG